YSTSGHWHATRRSLTWRSDRRGAGRRLPVRNISGLQEACGRPGRGPEKMKNFDTTSILSTLRSNRTISALFVALVLSLILLCINFLYVSVQSSYDTEYIGHSGELRVLSQQISKSATEAATGTREAFPLLLQARNDYEQRWGYLANGREETGLPPTPGALSDELAAAGAHWAKLRNNADAILNSEETVLALHEVAAQLSDTVPQLQVEYEDVVDVLIESGASAHQVS